MKGFTDVVGGMTLLGFARQCTCSWEAYIEIFRCEGGMTSVVCILLSKACEGRSGKGREKGRAGREGKRQEGDRKGRKGRRRKVNGNKNTV